MGRPRWAPKRGYRPAAKRLDFSIRAHAEGNLPLESHLRGRIGGAFRLSVGGEGDGVGAAGREVYITSQLCKAIARGGLRARRLLFNAKRRDRKATYDNGPLSDAPRGVTSRPGGVNWRPEAVRKKTGVYFFLFQRLTFPFNGNVFR